jgi:hypothetical protein
MERARDKMNASRSELIGFKTEMCLTSDRFQRKRSTKVVRRIDNTNNKISDNMSEVFLALAISRIILLY